MGQGWAGWSSVLPAHLHCFVALAPEEKQLRLARFCGGQLLHVRHEEQLVHLQYDWGTGGVRMLGHWGEPWDAT